ncbi:MAG: hypothetical protein ACKUBY_05095 [Candidatus Moraniibacteriota bacterium]|jgi:hypothetical protein
MNNNVQKIYVDVDEEITTVIDRLKQSSYINIEVIVPQHALLLQSVVNLKLLLQESKRYGKKMLLITNDEDGMSFAQRAGINVKYFAEDEDIRANSLGTNQENHVEIKKNQHIPVKNNKINQNQIPISTPIVSSSVGMDMGHSESMQQAKKSSRMNAVPQRNISNSSVSGVAMGGEVHQRQSKVAPKQQMHGGYAKKQEMGFDEYEKTLKNSVVSNGMSHQNNFQNQYSESAEKNHTKNKKKVKKAKKQQSEVAMSSTSKFVVRSFVGAVSVMLVIAVMVIILPKTKLEIEPKQINIDETMEMTAKADQSIADADRRIIPARVIERDMTFTKTFNATGTGDVDAQKAQGTITIFNEFSNVSQPLVATTRFLAEDGTLFRLVKAATVPGMKGTEPGSVEALVIADKSGESSNIAPTKFSIPGFSSGPKKEKIYAMSERVMTGGGVGGDGVSLVAEEDIEAAENQMNEELDEYIKSQINGLLRPDDEVLLDENVKYEILRSEPSVSAGTMADQFMYEIVSDVEAIIFSQQDVIGVMESNLSEKYNQYNREKVDVNVEYSNVSSDFENDSVKMSARGSAVVVATVDVDSFRDDIRGEKHDDLLSVIESEYKDVIEKIILESVVPGFPVFISDHISKFDFMTEIKVR